jgi:hypothetical protein
MEANKTSKATQKQSNKNKGTIFTPNDDNGLNAYESPLPSSTEDRNHFSHDTDDRSPNKGDKQININNKKPINI